jgi:hypothetical protein
MPPSSVIVIAFTQIAVAIEIHFGSQSGGRPGYDSILPASPIDKINVAT